MKLGRRTALALLSLVTCGSPLPATSQVPPGNTAATQAEAAVQRGLALAQQKQWPLAIRYFRQAHQTSPSHPAILLNLALANDRSGGRDLIASAWYRAFLAAAPDARNAHQVTQRLNEIEIAAEAQIQQLVATALRIAGEAQTPIERARIYGATARAQAASGDAAAMRRILALGPSKEDADWGLAIAAAHKAWTENPELAKSEAIAIGSAQQQSWGLAEIAVAFVHRGNLADGLATAAAIKNKAENAYALSRIAALRARIDDIAGARAAADQIDAQRHPVERTSAFAIIASYLARNDAAAAAAELAAAEATLSAIKEPKLRSAAETHIVVARILANSGAGAEAELNRLSDGAPRYQALKSLAAIRDDKTAAQIFHWTALALVMEEVPNLADLSTTIESAKSRSPAESGLAIARAAEDQARYANRLRYGD